MAEKQPAEAKEAPAPSGEAEENKRDGPQVWVSSAQRGRRRMAFYHNLTLEKLQKFQMVELHGLGEAVALVVEVSQQLGEGPFCKVEKISTDLISTQASRNMPKIVISLRRLKTPTEADIPARTAPVKKKRKEEDDEGDEEDASNE
eukprot:gb/GEZN01016809.1/.p1 GENE.gb/GEZN01016809.1/~~gb/GEZN01016809.1/.p1  ORF type:complete len:146 (-),score=37.58 gb/GEZN01016809.1/:46-483(-)